MFSTMNKIKDLNPHRTFINYFQVKKFDNFLSYFEIKKRITYS